MSTAKLNSKVPTSKDVERIRQKYPDRIPVWIDNPYDHNAQRKFLVPKDMTLSVFLHGYRSKHSNILCQSNEAFYYFDPHTNTLLTLNQTMAQVDHSHRSSQDGLVHILVQKEASFGSSSHPPSDYLLVKRVGNRMAVVHTSSTSAASTYTSSKSTPDSTSKQIMPKESIPITKAIPTPLNIKSSPSPSPSSSSFSSCSSSSSTLLVSTPDWSRQEWKEDEKLHHVYHYGTLMTAKPMQKEIQLPTKDGSASDTIMEQDALYELVLHDPNATLPSSDVFMMLMERLAWPPYIIGFASTSELPFHGQIPRLQTMDPGTSTLYHIYFL